MERLGTLLFAGVLTTAGLAFGQEQTPEPMPAEASQEENQEGGEAARLRAEIQQLQRALAQAQQAIAERDRAREMSEKARQEEMKARMIAEEQRQLAQVHAADVVRARQQMAELRAEAQRQREKASVRRQWERSKESQEVPGQRASEEAGQAETRDRDAEEMRRRQEFFRRQMGQQSDGGRKARAERGSSEEKESADEKASHGDTQLAQQLRRQEQRLARVERQLDTLLERLSGDRAREVRGRAEGENTGRLRDASPEGERDERFKQREEELRKQMAELTSAREQAMAALTEAELELQKVEMVRDQLARRVREQRAGIEALDRQLRAVATAGQKLGQRLRSEGDRERPQRRETRRPERPNDPI